MIRDHTTIEELLAVRSLGGLDGEDVQILERELAAHGDCEECRRLGSAYAETAGRLAFALDPVPTEPGAADVILRSARARKERGRTWWTLGAAAAVVVLAISAIALFFGSSRSTDVQASTNQTVVHFTGTGGELAMAYEPGQPGAVLLGSDFEDPGADKVFEIWMISGDTPVSGGCVRPVDGSITAVVKGDVSGADLMAVTVESDACPSQPTTTPILTAPLTV